MQMKGHLKTFQRPFECLLRPLKTFNGLFKSLKGLGRWPHAHQTSWTSRLSILAPRHGKRVRFVFASLLIANLRKGFVWAHAAFKCGLRARVPLWNPYGSLMEAVWDSYGLLVESVWNPYGTLIESSWSLYWVLMESWRKTLWKPYGISLKIIRNWCGEPWPFAIWKP